MKRKRRRIGYSSDLLTGGTKDVNPQFMSGTLKQETMNVDIDHSYQNPVAKGIFAIGGKATVMEILNVFIEIPKLAHFSSDPVLARAVRCYISTKKVLPVTPVFSIEEPSVFAWGIQFIYEGFTAAGSLMWGYDPVSCIDLTDNVGHGLLVASDKIWFTIVTTACTVSIDNCSFKILYRFKNVSVQEYVGIAQSQQ